MSLALSFVLALWAASSGMGNLIEGVSLAYNARGRTGLLTWLLISALAVLVGAEINAQLEIRTGHKAGNWHTNEGGDTAT